MVERLSSVEFRKDLFADERDDRIANAEAIIGELVAAGVRFERS